MSSRTAPHSVHFADGFGVSVFVSALSIGNLDTRDGGSLGVDLVAGAAPTTSGTISGFVDHTVTLGEGGYPSTLVITSTGEIDSESIGVDVPRDITGASIVNMGTIQGGIGVDVAALGIVITNDGLIEGGGGVRAYYAGGNGIDLKRGGTLTNLGTIAGGKGGGGAAGGIGVLITSHTAVITNSGLIAGGYGGTADQPDVGGTGGIGVSIAGHATLTNTGTIVGGHGGYASGTGGVGVLFASTGTLSNSGTIEGGAGGTTNYGHGGTGGIGVVMTDDATLINSGTITGFGGDRHQPAYAVRMNDGGTLIVDPGAVFNGYVGSNGGLLELGGTAAGTISGLGTEFTGFTTLTELAGANWTLNGQNVLYAGYTIRNAGTMSFLGELTNRGTMDVSSGTLSLLGTTANNGTIEAASGVVTSMYGVAGNGTLEVGATGTLSLQNGALAGQTLDFLAATGLVELDHPLSFFGQIVGFHAGDIIDLTKPTGFAETGYSYSGGVLTIMDGSATVASLHFQGNYTTSDFSLGADGHGGLYLTFV